MCRYDCDTSTVTVQTAEFSRRENAQFRSDAGLKCWIVRTTDGKCCAWCSAKAGRYVYGEEPQDVYRRHDKCGCTVVYESGRTRQDVWSKRTWESDQPTPVRVEPTRLTGAQGREIEQRNLSQITRFSHAQGEAVQAQNLRYRGLTSGGGSGIIKSLDIDDFKMMAEGHGIDPEALEVIASVVSEYEKSGLVHIDDFYFGSLANTATGTPLLQIDPIADRTLRLNVNTVWFNGKTLSDIDSALKAYEKNLAVSLREAVIHEMGHAKAIKGMTLKDIRNFYAEIRDAKVKDVSKIAYNDGAEALAEIEILISRGSDIPQAAIEFYNKYMRRKYP